MVLLSPRASELSVYVVQAFVVLRRPSKEKAAGKKA